MTRVLFSEDEVRNYLDRCIKRWRETLHNQKAGRVDPDRIQQAVCSIAAYQNVRVSLFGQRLREDKGNGGSDSP